MVAFIVIFYTFFGGYLAVSITDFFQGVIMLIAMVMVPTVALIDLNGIDTFKQAAEMKPTNMNLFKGHNRFRYHFTVCLGIGLFRTTSYYC